MPTVVAFYADLCARFLGQIPYILCIFVAEAALVSHVHLVDRRRLGRLAPNLAIGLLHVLVQPLVAVVMLRVLALPLAAATETFTIGVWSALPTVPALVVGAVFADLGIYVGHRLMHTVPLLWRFHRVHHSDPEFSPAVTHLNHPVSAVFDVGVPLLVVRLIGVPCDSLVAWKSIQVWNATFQHTQIVLPRRLESVLERVFILPRHHAIHHSIDPRQSNSNYCFVFNFWDRLFGTFRSDPIDANMRFGIVGDPTAEPRSVGEMLAMPWTPLASAGPEQERS